jgi:hypothetical protein
MFYTTMAAASLLLIGCDEKKPPTRIACTDREVFWPVDWVPHPNLPEELPDDPNQVRDEDGNPIA